MGTTKKVVSVVLPPHLEKEIYRLRSTEEYNRCSIGEILRRLMIAGLAKEGLERGNMEEGRMEMKEGIRLELSGYQRYFTLFEDEPGMIGLVDTKRKVFWINDSFEQDAKEKYIRFE